MDLHVDPIKRSFGAVVDRHVADVEHDLTLWRPAAAERSGDRRCLRDLAVLREDANTRAGRRAQALFERGPIP